MSVPKGYKLTEVGVIPDDWSVLPLSELSIKIQDGTHFSPKLGGNEYLYITSKNIKNGFLDLSNVDYISLSEHKKIYRRCDVKYGDLLLTKDGVNTGNAAINKLCEEFSLLSSVAFVRFDNSRYDSRFFLQQILSHDGQKRINDAMSGNAITRLTLEKINNLLFYIPPTLDEQKAIAEVLSDTDALLESLDRLIVKKRDLKQSTMQQLLTGKTRLPGFSGEWRTVELGTVISKCSSGATPYRGRSDFYKGRVKWITSSELNYCIIYDTLEHISEEAVTKTNLTIHPVGTFLMAITGLEAVGTRGACGIVGAPATTNQSCMAVYPKDELITQYLYHYYVCHGDNLALKYCQGTKQQSYTAKLVKTLPINLPPSVAEQKAIAAILSDMDAEIAALEQRRDKTRLLKQGMMQELLTGKTRLI